MKFVDLSHAIAHGTAAYPGLPQPAFTAHLTREESRRNYDGASEFQIDHIAMVGNTGTYLDSPFHRFEGGADLAALDLSRLANLAGVVVHVPRDVRAIEPEIIPRDLPAGGCVLLDTGWDRHWNTGAYAVDAPYLTRKAAEILARAEVALVGIDAVNMDDTADGARPAHTVLLENDIAVVEHLCNLGQLDGEPFRFFAVAPPLRGVGTFTVRAFAILH
jgi:arylformamidase